MFGKGGHSKQSICHKMSEITGQKRGKSGELKKPRRKTPGWPMGTEPAQRGEAWGTQIAPPSGNKKRIQEKERKEKCPVGEIEVVE